MLDEPSLTEVAPVRVTVGATLLTVTATVSESEAPSLSLTVTLTVELAGPSGKWHEDARIAANGKQ